MLEQTKTLFSAAKSNTATMITNVYLNTTQRIEINCPTEKPADLYEAVSTALKLSRHEFYLTQNGRRIMDVVELGQIIRFHLRMIAGKGGFGSMLRAIGAQIEKTTNREACRDLSGRRLRDINEEKRLKEWLEKNGNQSDDEQAKIQRKIAKLRAAPKHEFKDDKYFEDRTNMADDLHDAVEEGLKNAIALAGCSQADGEASGSNGKSTKRKTGEPETTKVKAKKKKTMKGAQWLDDGLSSSDSSSDESTEENSNQSGDGTDDESNRKQIAAN